MSVKKGPTALAVGPPSRTVSFVHVRLWNAKGTFVAGVARGSQSILPSPSASLRAGSAGVRSSYWLVSWGLRPFLVRSGLWPQRTRLTMGIRIGGNSLTGRWNVGGRGVLRRAKCALLRMTGQNSYPFDSLTGRWNVGGHGGPSSGKMRPPQDDNQELRPRGSQNPHFSRTNRARNGAPDSYSSFGRALRGAEAAALPQFTLTAALPQLTLTARSMLTAGGL
jgi:hypothetical protein